MRIFNLIIIATFIVLLISCNKYGQYDPTADYPNWESINNVQMSCTYWEDLGDEFNNPYQDLDEYEVPRIPDDHADSTWESLNDPDAEDPIGDPAAPDPGLLPLYTEEAQRVLEIVNEHRAAGYTCGSDYQPPVPPLNWSEHLARSSQKHSQDMADNNYFDHVSLDGRTFADRIRVEDYPGSPGGENIAYGYPTPEAVMNGWMNSEGHCKNIMRSSFDDIGTGKSDSENYWTQNFGMR
jgi:hypothetical protein